MRWPVILALLLLPDKTGIAQCNKHSFYRQPALKPASGISLIILGTIQDGGSPHMGCKRDCCKRLFSSPDKDRRVVSLGIVDAVGHRTYLLEASPDLAQQAKALKNYAAFNDQETPDGIFLTHAHIGHYTGLMFLGKEAMNAQNVPVFIMPRMKTFLEQNGPWSQLVSNRNISLQEMKDEEELRLTSSLKITPFRVPHRDEFSETVGYIISGPHKKALFIPDIDKWQKWKTDIREIISRVDYAFIDGTFYDGGEIYNRDISTIPHPFIIETMALLKDMPAAEKGKVYFIHLNHTNPVINKNSKEYRRVVQQGFHVAAIRERFAL